MGLWRNGSASDSRSEGWEFECLWPHLRRGLSVARPPCPDLGGPGPNPDLEVWQFPPCRGYGATAARLTPDQKVGSSNLSALKHFSAAASGLGHTTLPGDVAAWPCHTGITAVFRARGGGSNPPSQPVRGGQSLPAATQAASRHNKKTAAGP